MCALDYILDYEEWMDCSYFNDDMRARLKGENFCAMLHVVIYKSGDVCKIVHQSVLDV